VAAEARKPWLLTAALAAGLVALGAGVWLVFNAARSAGNDAARGRARPREVSPAQEALIVEALERDHGSRPQIVSIESETLSGDPAHQDKLYRVTYHAPGEEGLPRVRFLLGTGEQLRPLDTEISLGWERGDWRQQARQAKRLSNDAWEFPARPWRCRPASSIATRIRSGNDRLDRLKREER
jgi:hypothetical protein